jgi:hypothetical protein
MEVLGVCRFCDSMIFEGNELAVHYTYNVGKFNESGFVHRLCLVQFGYTRKIRVQAYVDLCKILPAMVDLQRELGSCHIVFDQIRLELA